MHDLDLLRRANPHPTGEAPASPAHLVESIVEDVGVGRVAVQERRWHPAIVAVAAALAVLVGVGGLLVGGVVFDGGPDVANPDTTPSLVDDAPIPPATEAVSPTVTPPAVTPRVEPGLLECSAGPMSIGAQPALPSAVSATREEIVAAALACDFDALAAIATPTFTYSFGEGGNPAAYWRAGEARGSEAMRALVELLAMPSVVQEFDVTPDVVEQERDNLKLRLVGLGGLIDSLSERIDALGDALSAAQSADERARIAEDLSMQEVGLAHLLREHDAIELRLAELAELSEIETVYIWPSAAAYDTWDEVPAADRELLRSLYDDEAFEAFALFGSYTGWRVGITEAGTWLFFVAGD